MNNKIKGKGFTLVELLAVIIVLGIVGTIVTPIISGVMSNSREKLYKTQIENIALAAKSWGAGNVWELPKEENESITITLAQLKIAGLVEMDIKNIKTEELYPNDMEIEITLKNNDYHYIVKANTGNVGGSNDPYLALITLNGKTHEYVEIFTSYVEKGVRAKDPSGNEINDIDIIIKSKPNNNIVEYIDTSKLGQYTITYSVSYQSKTTAINRTVTVTDSTPPTLTIPSNVTIEGTAALNYNLMNGVSVIDNSGETITVVYEGNLSTVPGIYYIKYIAIDSSGNKTEKVRQITVIVGGVVEDTFNTDKGVNKPQLTEGMIPIKWNGTTETTTTKDDPDWYDYANKKWANAKTADGSYWVWIPRYAYKITSGYHKSTAGTIEVKFLKGKTNTTKDEINVEISGYNAGVKDTSMHYFLHPAFTFGTEEILGFWVAKFEPSVANQSDPCYTNEVNCNKTTLTPKIIPNAKSWRGTSIGNQFLISFNMKNNPVYGWEAVEVDTHMIKNTEWGAVAYLSKSIYGSNQEIWDNNSRIFITGCAGNTAKAESVASCQNEYHTTNGVKASTTHNIYGVYDMNGGSQEYVAAYLDNGNSYLTTYGQSLLTAEAKHKNIYITGATDRWDQNYEANSDKYGDAIYEISSSTSYGSAWYSNVVSMPYDNFPWINRTRLYYFDGSYFDTEALVFYNNDGGASDYSSFRPIVITK